MTFTDGQKSTGNEECPTPQYLFNYFDKRFHFDLDPCATPENTKCKKYFTKNEDGLKQPWHGVVFLNPPYGDEIPPWVAKAAEYARGGGITVAVLPARTDSVWWQTYVTQATEIWFLMGRVHFESYPSGAPFPTAIAIFGTPKEPIIKHVQIIDPEHPPRTIKTECRWELKQ